MSYLGWCVVAVLMFALYLFGRLTGYATGWRHGHRDTLRRMRWNTSPEGKEESNQAFDDAMRTP